MINLEALAYTLNTLISDLSTGVKAVEIATGVSGTKRISVVKK